MELYKIETGNAMFDGGAVFGVVPKKIWSNIYPVNEDNLCNFSMRSLLIVDNNTKILIDTGIGNKQDEKFLKNFHLNGNNSLIKSLNSYGFSNYDITDVILTHLHFDHCGGVTYLNYEKNKIELTFPNASIHISEGQWAWANNPNKREMATFLKENIQSIAESGKLNLVKNEGLIFDNIEIRFFYGHTEAQMIPFIKYNEQTIVFSGDFLASAAHIPLPYIPAYDIRPLITLEEKEKFYNEAISNNYIIFFEHDLNNECCNLQMTNKGVKVKETFSLKYFLNKC